ncbi:MAG: hypothetical protein E7542_01500 [Ruminococcaceae bacterium]|nr:hypothetical protein [Oscillospiraceae bacterium]
MEFLKYFILGIMILCFLIIFILAARERKLLKFILSNAFFGVVTFLIIYLLKDFIGIKLALNWYTVSSASVLGVPAVLLFLFLNLII